jgi:16S rRNA (guanine527-N7)-methyltransferase
MDPARIAELLQPYLGDQTLTPNDLENISTYIDLLLHWNARINLTAIRHPEEIVTRHFGESLFAASHLFPIRTHLGEDAPARAAEQSSASPGVVDVGSGAGFPGLPVKFWAPNINLTLIESNQKKATFLREIIRKFAFTSINVFQGRAEDYPKQSTELVTLRAVERFDTSLPIAAGLVAPCGRLALLIGEAQLARTHDLTPEFTWAPPLLVPDSASRVLATGFRR